MPQRNNERMKVINQFKVKCESHRSLKHLKSLAFSEPWDQHQDFIIRAVEVQERVIFAFLRNLLLSRDFI